MTGQGSSHIQHNGVAVTAELRTVNNRYFKLSFRASDGFGPLESRVEELVRQSIRRGTVQLDLRVDRESSAESFRLNEAALTSYVSQLRTLAQHLGTDGDIRLDALLTLPGVIDEHSAGSDELDSAWPTIQKAVQEALGCLARMREGEGRAMATDLEANCRTISQELAAVERLAPQVVESYRTRIGDKIKKLLAEHGVATQVADVVREVGLFSERTDISEETVRLRSHLEQFQTIMNGAESNGRKLDFITQEMFRETNTIGSKANDAAIARHIVDIKTAIERIREMIQNVE